MARRKLVAVGRANSAWFDQAIGYLPHVHILDLLSDTEKPSFDFCALESRTGLRLDQEQQDDISRAYTAYALSVMKMVLSDASHSDDSFGAQPKVEIDQTEFRSLVRMLQKTAVELRVVVDRLAEFDSGLLARPHDNRDRSIYGANRRQAIDVNLCSSDASHTTVAGDFADYYSFRKLLDYFENFESCNERFNNMYDLRYSIEEGRSEFEFLARQVIVVLRRGGYPRTITIPTDSNPHYESPMIAALLELQRQHNLQFKDVKLRSGALEQKFNYRKFAHFAGLILRQIDDIEEAFSALRRDHRV